MDSHLYPDYLVPPNYDSLLGKLIVWAEDRDQVGRGYICSLQGVSARGYQRCWCEGNPTWGAEISTRSDH
jgi:biotin carboxylase